MQNEQPVLSKEHAHIIAMWLEAQRRARLREASDRLITGVMRHESEDFTINKTGDEQRESTKCT